MRIATLNTWNEQGPWKDRWELTLDELEPIKPDIVGFQEFITPYLIPDITERLNLPYWYYPDRSSGLIIFSRYALGQGVNRPYATQSPTENYRRQALLVPVRVGLSDLWFVNTHLSWRPEEAAVRRGQIEELLQWIAEIARGLPVIAVGDFNAHDTADEMKLLKEAGFIDVYDLLHPDDAGLTWDNRNVFTASHQMPDRRLDYIFARHIDPFPGNPISCRLFGIAANKAGIFASDHAGVFAEFGS